MSMAHTITDWRFSFNMNINKLNQIFYLPLIPLYYDYDFRNLQAFELFEDSYWETIYPALNYEEYIDINENFINYQFFDKYDIFFNTVNREIEPKDQVISKPFIKDLTNFKIHYPLSLYFDETIIPTNLISTNNYI